MYPVLLKLGPLTIHTYGFFVALGFFLGILFARTQGEKAGIHPERILDLSLYILIAGIIGARLFFVFVEPRQFMENPLLVFRIWEGGLVFYGGFIAALATGIIYLKVMDIPVLKTADIAAPALALGHGIGRLGCFFAGCCYGDACTLPWAVTFTHPESLAPRFVSLHPTQLYSSFANLVLFLVLFAGLKKKQFDGQIFSVYLILYGIIRFVLEIFRGDYRGETWFDILSISQVIGIVMSIAGTAFLIALFLRHRARGFGSNEDGGNSKGQ